MQQLQQTNRGKEKEKQKRFSEIAQTLIQNQQSKRITKENAYYAYIRNAGFRI